MNSEAASASTELQRHFGRRQVPLKRSRISKCLEILLAYCKHQITLQTQKKAELFEVGRSQPILIQFSLKKLADPKLYKAVNLAVPFNPYLERDIALIVPDKEDKTPEQSVKFFKEYFQKLDITDRISVYTISMLKAETRTMEDKQKLVRRHDAFFADEKVYRVLPKFLGTTFTKAKKFPVSVKLRKPSKVKGVLNASTFFLTGKGNCFAYVIGHTGMTIDQLVENALASLEKLVVNIPIGWPNIRGLGIKTKTSILVPLYDASIVGSKTITETYASGNVDSDKKMDVSENINSNKLISQKNLKLNVSQSVIMSSPEVAVTKNLMSSKKLTLDASMEKQLSPSKQKDESFSTKKSSKSDLKRKLPLTENVKAGTNDKSHISIKYNLLDPAIVAKKAARKAKKNEAVIPNNLADLFDDTAEQKRIERKNRKDWKAEEDNDSLLIPGMFHLSDDEVDGKYSMQLARKRKSKVATTLSTPVRRSVRLSAAPSSTCTSENIASSLAEPPMDKNDYGVSRLSAVQERNSVKKAKIATLKPSVVK